jgi:hypothetical protein
MVGRGGAENADPAANRPRRVREFVGCRRGCIGWFAAVGRRCTDRSGGRCNFGRIVGCCGAVSCRCTDRFVVYAAAGDVVFAAAAASEFVIARNS